MKLSIMHFVKLFSLLISGLLMSSCQQGEKKENAVHHKKEYFEDYKNKNDLEKYLNKEFSLKTDSKGIDTVFLIPINSCDKCVDVVLKSIKVNKFSGLIVFGGNIKYKPVFKGIYHDLLATEFCVVDTINKMFQYNIDVYSPTLVILKRDKPVIAHLDFQNWKAIRKKISWK